MSASGADASASLSVVVAFVNLFNIRKAYQSAFRPTKPLSNKALERAFDAAIPLLQNSEIGEVAKLAKEVKLFEGKERTAVERKLREARSRILTKLLKLPLKDIVPKGHGEISVLKKDLISDPQESEKVWEIYNHTFEKVNRMSPCKQSFDRDHFLEALHDPTIHKYLLHSDSVGTIGLALITNDFKNAPWISSDYFKAHFSDAFEKKEIYYFLGLAIHEHFRSRRYSLLLIEHIIDDIPHHAVLGFDHSRNINPLLHHFTKVVKQARSIIRTHIDRQHYHVVQRR